MKAEKGNTAVIIPAYNAAKYLEELVSQLSEYILQENIIVVNDASLDSTNEVCKKLSIKVLEHPINKGKGAALLTGFREALRNGFQFAITIDADLQHDPATISSFLTKQSEGDFDMVIGRRIFKLGLMPVHRICSNRMTSQIVSWISRRKIYDSQSGYRLYRLSFIDKMKLISKRYQFESEIIVKYARRGGRFGFVPIETIYNGQESHISNLRDIVNFVKIMWHEMFHADGDN
ncbi:glycosyltransferase family 2 protein [Candidatus Cloacimonadota bacterium]